MKPINWNFLFDNYKGKWVALKGDERIVVASGNDAKVVYEEAVKKGVKIPTLFKVPTSSVLFVG